MAPLNGQDDALADLMAAKQWKQAFNLCEKKMKKAKGSDLHRVCAMPSAISQSIALT